MRDPSSTMVVSAAGALPVPSINVAPSITVRLPDAVSGFGAWEQAARKIKRHDSVKNGTKARLGIGILEMMGQKNGASLQRRRDRRGSTESRAHCRQKYTMESSHSLRTLSGLCLRCEYFPTAPVRLKFSCAAW